MTQNPPRKHHLRFKYRVADAALTDGALFAATYTAPDGAARLAALWAAAGEGLPEEERLPGDGLALSWKGEAGSPLVFVAPPAPRNLNEAHYIAAIPTVAAGPVFRVFVLERSRMPQSDEPLVFVVEIRPGARDNYGPPRDEAPNDSSFGLFCNAIVDICEGKRKPYASTPR